MSIQDDAENLKASLNDLDKTKVLIALFGQPGSGKSSLINALTGQDLAESGDETDVTKKESRYEWKGLQLVDLPGYGTKDFPASGYFQRFSIESFDAFLFVFDGKIRENDEQFYEDLKKINRPVIFVRNKIDALFQPGKSESSQREKISLDIKKRFGEAANFVFTSCKSKIGIDTLSDRISEVLGGAKRERYFRAAKAHSIEFLEKKRKAAEREVLLYSGIAAANALNPVPGVDIAVDVSVLVKLFDSLKTTYGLTKERINSLEVAAPALVPFANQLVEYATKEGILLLLKKFAGKVTIKEVTKYIPFVGQAIAATLGFAITYKAGSSYLEDCHAIAGKLLELELGHRRTLGENIVQ